MSTPGNWYLVSNKLEHTGYGEVFKKFSGAGSGVVPYGW